jgi:hypothetical protein
LVEEEKDREIHGERRLSMSGQQPKFPFDYNWWFMGGKDKQGRVVAGTVCISNQPKGGNAVWNIPVVSFDVMAQKHMQSLMNMPGLPVSFQDGSSHDMPYRKLDADADVWISLGMPPAGPDAKPEPLVFMDGVRMNDAPRSFYETLLTAHIQWRSQFPPVNIKLQDGSQLQMSFLNYDAVCKDFMRRRADLLAIGWWPELLIHERVIDPNKPGPLPVEGRPNALGQGVKVLSPADLAQQQVPQGPARHPMQDNDGLT